MSTIFNHLQMGVGKLLLLLYFSSFLLTVFLLTAFILLTQGTPDDVRVFYMIIAGSLFINFPLLFISAPGLLISYRFADNKQKAFIACFITPAVIFILILSGALKLQPGDMEAYSITTASFMLVVAYFFFKNRTPNNFKPIDDEVN